MTYLLTLVHGTWPDPQGWASARSFLRRELATRLGDVVFREFPWSGGNTHEDRTQAGEQLARFLRDGRDQFPDARHIVIAHSHGGNVTLYAMRDPVADQSVDGVVTLGAPFLSARPRNLGAHADVIAWVTLGVLAMAALTVVDALRLWYGFPTWLLCSALMIVRTSPAVAAWLVRAGRLEQDMIIPAWQPPRIDRSRIFVVSARGDEAAHWLRAWEIVATGPFLTGCLFLAVVEVELRGNIATILNGLGQSIFHRGLADIHVFGLNGLPLAVAGLTLCFVWGILLPLVSSIVRWPGYWREPLLANVLVKIGSSRAPVAHDGERHTVHTFDVPRESLLRRIVKDHLRHSAICEQPAVVAAISDWVQASGIRPQESGLS